MPTNSRIAIQSEELTVKVRNKNENENREAFPHFNQVHVSVKPGPSFYPQIISPPENRNPVTTSSIVSNMRSSSRVCHFLTISVAVSNKINPIRHQIIL